MRMELAKNRQRASSLRLHQVRIHGEDGPLQTRKWALTGHRICLRLDLGFPSFQNWRNKCMLCCFKPPPSLFLSFFFFFLFLFRTRDMILVATVTTGMGGAKAKWQGVGSGQRALGTPGADGAAPGWAARWRRGTGRSAMGLRRPSRAPAASVVPGVSRSGPPLGRWAREAPSSGLRVLSLHPSRGSAAPTGRGLVQRSQPGPRPAQSAQVSAQLLPRCGPPAAPGGGHGGDASAEPARLSR